nr:HAMP domain-containing sensor histidine kinase [uncultured Acetatifactor sp.]
MYVLFILSVMTCVFLILFHIRLCLDIRSLCGQLNEIARGSHLELAVNSRQHVLLTLCRKMNQVLAAKDIEHFRYNKAEKQLKQSITNLAHDIRTPLTGASGYIQLARECRNSEKRDHYLEISSIRLTELEDMLEKLFLYTKLTNEEFTFSRDSLKKVQVFPLLESCLLSFYTEFEKKGISPEISFSSKSFYVSAEEDALKRIFLNLIQNALIHGAGGLAISQMEITSELIDAAHSCMNAAYRPKLLSQKVSVIVFENPVQVDSTLDPARIFDRFYKADPARGKSSSGLGLFIVQELMKKMGGDVKAELHDNMLRVQLLFSVQSDRSSSDLSS